MHWLRGFAGAEWPKIVGQIAQSVLRLRDYQLLEALPVERVIELDVALRSGRYYSSEWWELTAASIAWREREFIALASCHPNGYIREAALRAFSGRPELFPFVIVRLSDWVEPVRAVAAALFRAQVELLDAETLVDCLGLIERVRRGERFREEYLTWLDDALRRPSSIDALRRGASLGTPAVRLRCCRLLPSVEGVERGLADNDVAVRRWAFDAAQALLPREELMRRAAADSHVSIRRLAFGAELSKEQLREFLFDRAGSIRGEAQARFGAGAVEEYRAALRNDAASATAVVGLGETGERPDRDLIVPMLSHSHVRVRRAAVRAAARFGCDGLEEVLLAMIESDRPTVLGEAASALLRERVVGAERVWRAAIRNPHEGVARRVLLRICVAGKWERLAVYLEAAGTGDCELASRLVKAWTVSFNRTAVRPSAEELSRIRERFELVRPRLPRELADEIAFTVRVEGERT